MNDWHLRKEVTIGNILTAVAALTAAVAAYYNLDTRVSLLEERTTEERIDREKDVERICGRLDRIENILLDIRKYETGN